MGKDIRVIPGSEIQDPGNIKNLEYNNAAGASKVAEVGRNVVPLKFISGGVVAYTTNATTAKIVDKLGVNLAVYNNAGAVGSITLGSSPTVPPTVLAPGVTDASGGVGIPCQPNAWTYIAMYKNQWVISSAATLLVFVIEDDTNIKKEWTSTPIG